MGRRRNPLHLPHRRCDLPKGQRRGPFRASGAALPLFSPVLAPPSAFAALPGGGVAPVPIQPVKRGVSLLWAAVAEWVPGR